MSFDGDNPFDCADCGAFERNDETEKDSELGLDVEESLDLNSEDSNYVEEEKPTAQEEAGSADVSEAIGEIVAKPRVRGVEELYRETFGDWNT